ARVTCITCITGSGGLALVVGGRLGLEVAVRVAAVAADPPAIVAVLARIELPITAASLLGHCDHTKRVDVPAAELQSPVGVERVGDLDIAVSRLRRDVDVVKAPAPVSVMPGRVKVRRAGEVRPHRVTIDGDPRLIEVAVLDVE